MGLWKAFRPNVAAIEIGFGLLLLISSVPILLFLRNKPVDHLWLRIAVSGLLGMVAGRALSYNIERADPSDEKMRRWLFGVYLGLSYGAWQSVLFVAGYGDWFLINLFVSGGVYGGFMVAMNRPISLAKAGGHGYDVTQPGRGFRSIKLSLLYVFNSAVLAFSVSQFLSQGRFVGPDYLSNPLLFCAVLALFLAWTPRAYRPLEMGRLGDIALPIRLTLSLAVIGGVAAPFFFG